MKGVCVCLHCCTDLSVPKWGVPKTLAITVGLRLRSKTRRSKTRVLGRRVPNGKPKQVAI